MSRKPKSNHTGLKVVLILLILVMIAATVFMIKLCIGVAGAEPSPNRVKLPAFLQSMLEKVPTEELIPDAPQETPETETTEPTDPPTEPTLPEPEHVVSTATVSATGDVLMHMPVVNSGAQKDGGYNFDYIFRHLAEYTNAADYAVANLETTLAGTDNGYPYHGYPNFNCPDEIVDGAMSAGFDMFLTANNHSYDTSLVGYKRTLEVIRGKGMDTLGTYASADEVKWTIKEINGINIGMLCYTYAYSVTEDGRPSLNGMPHIAEAGLCNYFHSDNLPKFYEEVGGYMEEMEAAGAEATMMFIHWGVEYLTYANDQQKAIAQNLCDLGIDVIVGGHPHVIQPVQLLESTVDPNQKTVCLYSMGNAVSNQRYGNISYVNTAHTEDGLLFSATFEKYSDGTVYLQDVDILPCWVFMETTKFPNTYHILPLDDDTRDEWGTKYGLSEIHLKSAVKSYDRTMAIVGEGLAASQEYLAQAKADREQYYYDLVFNPEKLATEATEAATEDVTEEVTGEATEPTE